MLGKQVEVLIVGAGPVGMTAALMLAEQGIKATVVDGDRGTAAHSYACALHSDSLGLLERLELVDEILEWGYRVNSVGFYEGSRKRAEVKFAKLAGRFPFVVVLPQNALEWLLERTLGQRACIKVNWRHRVSGLRPIEGGVVAAIDELAEVPAQASNHRSEPIVSNTEEVNAAVLVGADGRESLVRERLGIPYERAGSAEHFLIFEFETDTELEHEVRVVLDETTSSVLWPIASRRGRWTFQIGGTPNGTMRPSEILAEDYGLNDLRELVEKRAPWFRGELKNLSWVSSVAFEQRVTKQFSDGRYWLIGDAAHQTGPIGVQSLNVGLREAAGLAWVLRNLSRGAANQTTWEIWNDRCLEEWHQLLGWRGELIVAKNGDNWVRQRAPRIIPCLPASGEDLTRLLNQLQIQPSDD